MKTTDRWKHSPPSLFNPILLYKCLIGTSWHRTFGSCLPRRKLRSVEKRLLPYGNIPFWMIWPWRWGVHRVHRVRLFGKKRILIPFGNSNMCINPRTHFWMWRRRSQRGIVAELGGWKSQRTNASGVDLVCNCNPSEFWSVIVSVAATSQWKCLIESKTNQKANDILSVTSISSDTHSLPIRLWINLSGTHKSALRRFAVFFFVQLPGIILHSSSVFINNRYYIFKAFFMAGIPYKIVVLFEMNELIN